LSRGFPVSVNQKFEFSVHIDQEPSPRFGQGIDSFR
jgi:hypothetical protein